MGKLFFTNSLTFLILHFQFLTNTMKQYYFKRFTLIVAIFLTGFQVAQAQKYSNEFLSIGIGARAHAMGGAVFASVNDVTAGYWNPAGLANFGSDRGLQLGAMHAEWFAGIAKYDYLGATIPLANADRRIGLSMIRFGVDGIPNTLSLFEDDGSVNYDNIVEFSAADYAFLLSYAQKMNLKNKDNNLYIGGNVKVVRRVIGTFANSWGFGIDLGMQYHTKRLKIGVVGRDLTSTFNAWKTNFSEEDKAVLLDTDNELPDVNSVEVTKPSIAVGLGYSFDFDNVTLTPEVSFVATTDGKRNTLIQGDPISIDPGAGVELGYNDFLFFRAGVNQFQYEQDFDKTETLTMRPSLGVGLKLGRLQLDYAFSNLGDNDNKFSHIISLIFEMKAKNKQVVRGF
ncbi:MAG: hypothetical protein ACI920_002693 [Saprospiraceae bacterium]